ncbi:hypothetical protein K0M31_001273 [Melipona bicolor]|uniref:Uncharacterized protein n=1 Tax=Melipona bicolor TaxID=60889 RepID=A0AA40GG45_9HYME|nr:hypothetical protein K0M31_001273 [Melipona bicolor]
MRNHGDCMGHRENKTKEKKNYVKSKSCEQKREKPAMSGSWQNEENSVVIIGGISYETPKLRDSQAGRGGCFPSFRVDRSHVNIAHLVVCNAKHTLVGSGTDDGLSR